MSGPIQVLPLDHGNMHHTNILSVNMQCRNAAMHSLLETNQTDNILCVQEPWFKKIGTAHKDSAKDGVDVLGGAVTIVPKTLTYR